MYHRNNLSNCNNIMIYYSYYLKPSLLQKPFVCPVMYHSTGGLAHVILVKARTQYSKPEILCNPESLVSRCRARWAGMSIPTTHFIFRALSCGFSPLQLKTTR